MKRRLDFSVEKSSKHKMIEDKDTNPYTKKVYSERYHTIMEKRKTLPVWEQQDEFLRIFKENQVLILQGETGSGKTTQVCR